ncbi:hypothetical protein [Ruminococcus sp.]|uniref:hypothetical protein n=1 Tax=Ruminococcus sp. TaxID=41978 RepID=UPI0025E9E607|nr:hypothetical protein [Ruminococcus sp.]
MNDMMNSLVEKYGVVVTEVFISTLIREPFGYTKWQREHFDGKTLEELNKAAVEYCKKVPLNH